MHHVGTMVPEGGICDEVNEVPHLCLWRLCIFLTYYSLNSLHTEKEFAFLVALCSSLYYTIVHCCKGCVRERAKLGKIGFDRDGPWWNGWK